MYVDDVARAVVDALENPATAGEVYPLGGPDRMTWPAMYRTAAEAIAGHARPVVAIPAWYAEVLARTVPGRLLPFGLDQVQMSQEPNTCDTEKFTNAFGWNPRPFGGDGASVRGRNRCGREEPTHVKRLTAAGLLQHLWTCRRPIRVAEATLPLYGSESRPIPFLFLNQAEWNSSKAASRSSPPSPHGDGGSRSFLVAHGAHVDKLDELLALAAELGVPVKTVERAELDAMAHGATHGGVLALATPLPRLSSPQLMDLLDGVRTPLLLLLEGVDDARNLGFTLRTAEALGRPRRAD